MAAKTKMVICDPSHADPAKTKVMGKVVRYTNTHETPIPKLLNEDGKSIDTGQIIITQKFYRYARTTSTQRWYRGDNLSLPWTGTSLL